MAILQSICTQKRNIRKKIFLISPVRLLKDTDKDKILKYAEKLEKKGYIVKLPFRDTNQNDEIGLRIVEEHMEDIIWADEIHIWLKIENGKIASEGSLFDSAQALMTKQFMPDKKIVIANINEIDTTENKSYINVLLAVHFGLTSENTLKDLKEKLRKEKL